MGNCDPRAGCRAKFPLRENGRGGITGDILGRIKDRIDTCSLLVGLLTGDNPNVYLEVGYAWGRGKPTVLAVKEGQQVRFDVQGQRYLKYRNIAGLRAMIRRQLDGLRESGVI